MVKIVFLVFLTLALTVIFTSAGPLRKRQIYRYKTNNRNALNINRIEKDPRKIKNNNNILKRKRLEAKKARLELIDEMLKFYWDTLEVLHTYIYVITYFFSFSHFCSQFFIPRS